MILHGLIHIMGFVKAFNLAPMKEMSGVAIIPLSETANKALGVLWLLACLSFLLSTGLLWLNQPWWWIVGAISIVLSQILIILYWKDAFAGSIANLLVIVGIIWILNSVKIGS